MVISPLLVRASYLNIVSIDWLANDAVQLQFNVLPEVTAATSSFMIVSDSLA
jgi:hypothetical protein